ncbi:DUF3108 domain-containing protein [Polaromonas sp.]|uniref:DUF3108 domain-containing protein n=1 Tax=Polaromonas sp. TaxID=1869339 RepID=UPI002FC94EE0
MKHGAAPWAGAPSWRTFAVLTALVIAIHALILQGQPAHWDLEGDAAAANHRPFITRTIAPSPVTPAAKPPAKPAPPIAPKPAGTPKPKPNQAAAPDSFGTTAINSIANQAPAEAPPEQAVAQVPAVEPTPPAPSPAAAAEVSIADSVRLEYDVTALSGNRPWYATGKLSWQREGDNYNAKMVVSALFRSRTWHSLGRVTPQGLAPERYSEKYRSEQAAHFQPDKGKITFSADTPDAPWVEGAQDRLSVFFQLASLLAGNPAKFRPDSTLALYTAGLREAETWIFMVTAEETLALPAGELAALKLTRRPRQEFDQKVEAWFAPSLGYLPVRIKITYQNGDFLDQQLSTVAQP